MASVNLDDVTPEQVLLLGDAALRLGRPKLALRFYTATPAATAAAHARIGLAMAGTHHSVQLLEVIDRVSQIDPQQAFVGSGLATWRKSTPFTEDPRFMEVATRHAHLLPMVNWHWNLQTVLWAVKATREIEGDFVELGVFKGHTSIFLADYLQFQTWTKAWLLYDTFDGIPDDQVDEGWAENNELHYRGTFSYEEVAARFAPYPNMRVIKGRVPEVLAEPQTPEKIAFLHMDLNNATAEIAALDVLFDRISPGGVIIFDDYCWAVAHRQRAEEDAWFAARGLSILPLPTGQGVFFKR